MARSTTSAAKIQARALRILADEIESGHRRPSSELARVLATEIDAPDTEDLSPEEWARAWGAEIDRRLTAAKSGRTKRRDLAAVLRWRVKASPTTQVAAGNLRPALPSDRRDSAPNRGTGRYPTETNGNHLFE